MKNEKFIEVAQIAQAKRDLRKKSSGGEIFDRINEAAKIYDLVAGHFGWEFDGKNFLREGKRVGCYVPEGENFLVHGGTEHIPNDKKGYDCFEFVKVMQGLNTPQTIDYFKSRYPGLGDPLTQKLDHHDLKKRAIALLDVTTSAPYTWGTPRLDEKMPLLLRGDYVFFPGETGSGKTTFSLFMARENARKGLKVLYFSLEMNEEGLVARYARECAGIKQDQLKGGVTDIQRLKYEEALDDLMAIHFLSLPKENTVEAISSALDETVDMVFIDNFGFLNGLGEQQTSREESIANGLLEICKQKKNIVLIVLHHWKKGTAKSGFKPRGTEEMKGSSRIGHNSFIVVQYFRDMTALNGECSLVINKNRNWGYLGRQTVFYRNGSFFDHNPINPVISREDVAGIF